uniref:WG repeat-containing protein n=1 Tax=Magnetococcus massalia (strain MO-1) TaxID=451514 RepID=A0A1S7LHH1_MAGMO|nr:protein of unknown function [Candidatus Magnetococcus massalia]
MGYLFLAPSATAAQAQWRESKSPLLAVFYTKSEKFFVSQQGKEVFGAGLNFRGALIKGGYARAFPSALTTSGERKARWYSRQGQPLTMPTYDGKNIVEATGGFSAGLGVVRWKSGSTNHANFMRESGALAFPDNFSSVQMFQDGLAEAKSLKTKRWGYINSSGSWVVPAKYKSVSRFNDGLAKVKNDAGLWALINTKGQLLTGFICRKPMFTQKGLAACYFPDKKNSTLLDASGKQTLATPAKSISARSYGWIVRHHDGQNDLRDLNGQTMVAKGEIYDAASKMGDGLIAAQKVKSGPYGFINLKGQWVIQPTYSRVAAFNEGRAFVMKEKKGPVQMIDTSGKLLATYPEATTLSKVGQMHEGLAAVGLKKGKKWRVGYVDPTGGWAIKPELSSSGSIQYARFVQGAAPACRGDYPQTQCGVIDTKGAWVTPPKYSGIKRGFH